MYVLIAIVAILIYVFDGHTLFINKYKKFRELNKLVATRHKAIFSIVWISICMVVKIYWLRFLQWINTSVVIVNKKRVDISYVLNGKLYTVVIRIKKGPSSVLLVSDQNNDDVSDLVLPYMGPNEDWHGQDFRPDFWGKELLVFDLSSGDTKIFSEYDIIKI